ncbi:predicted esterase [Longilinea arvoryzae]|uniref:Predicted esterase n=1 Tax=Longilinea arvoryzae TaxID=360412 RepID=A0A0S7BI44_9CHLR|nr:alpha/beta fold hydrolase [Longilinea arvoryzae]GAP14756.1 predicted esterase [Longilinea arvoryzae]
MVKRPDAYTLIENGWTVRVQAPIEMHSQRVIFLLHGWTGNETVMSIFGKQVAADYWLISPRGPVQAQPNGFGWLPAGSSVWASFRDYSEVTHELDVQVQHWLDILKITSEKFDLMGFSQGAAVSLCYLLQYPDRIGRVASLAGFLPEGAKELLVPDRLSGKAVLIAHGTVDKAVPFRRAQEAAAILSAAGAEVEFCQDEVGHKVGPTGYKKLRIFFA